jgi:hypothetical protein
MVEPGGDLDLAQESVVAQRCGKLGAEHLERHLAVQFQVLGEIDRSHPAAAELALDRVTSC